MAVRSGAAGAGAEAPNTFDESLLREWRRVLAIDGVLRGAPDGIHTRRSLGRNLHAQYSPDHASKKRPTTLSTKAEEIRVSRPFDASTFHFGKANPIEIVAWLHLPESPTAPTSRDAPAVAFASESGPSLSSDGDSSIGDGARSRDWHPLFVNPSPMFTGHCVLVPAHNDRLPQVLSASSLFGSLRLASCSSRADFRLLYNSLGAWASVNHLHLHPVYTDASFEAPGFPIERSPVRRVGVAAVRVGARPAAGDGKAATDAATGAVPCAFGMPPCSSVAWTGVGDAERTSGDAAGAAAGSEADEPVVSITIGATTEWPARALAFRVMEDDAGDDAARRPSVAEHGALAYVVGTLISQLVAANVAHNALVLDGGLGCIVVPRQVQRDVEGAGVRIASAEVMGMGQYLDPDAFAATSGDVYFDAIAQFSLSEREFASVTDALTDALDPAGSER